MSKEEKSKKSLQSMNVIQSYLTTIMRGEFSLYEIRIFIKIVELANHALKGHKVSPLLGTAVTVDGISCNCTIPIKSIMTPHSNDYTKVKAAVKRLTEKKFEMYDPEKKIWHYTRLLNDVAIAEGDGKLKFVAPVWLLEYILNFVDGNFSIYDLGTALSLPTAYSVRMYWLTNSMSEPVTYSIPMLRQMLGAEDKYTKTKDFIKRCIEPARKVLEDRKLNGFKFSNVMTKNRITAIRFQPVKRQEKKPAQLVAMANLSAWCAPALRNYLTTQCDFTIKELSAHKSLLMNFTAIKDWQKEIVEIVERQRRKRAGKGYIINSMKGVVEESKTGTTTR